MTSITGSTAPLHRRFDEKDALRQIGKRYNGMKEDIAEQVASLQRDERFLARCDYFYRQGYKDWHILAAVYNLMLSIRLKEKGNRLRTREEHEQSKEVPKELKGLVYPAKHFLTPELDTMFVTHGLTCLARLGFEVRLGVSSQPVLKFLRERMRHFELDIPHAPMFGSPPSAWPTVMEEK
ncbi:MAG: hypothetical protein JWM16_1241 [Verrucomicrobiales bacterium]|nr:hypothetical protein [Verrucomicrobiales bacterium]